jgi:hypothetical protein
MRRTVGLLVVAVALMAAGFAAARTADDLTLAQAHVLARQYAPDILLPTKVPAGITRVSYLQGMTFTPGIRPADLGMQFHGARTSPQFQLFFWRGRLHSAIVRAMTVTYTDKNSKYLQHAFTASRFKGTRISYLSGGSTANVVDDYIWESGGKTFVLSLFVTRLGKSINPWSKTAVIASFRAP